LPFQWNTVTLRFKVGLGLSRAVAWLEIHTNVFLPCPRMAMMASPKSLKNLKKMENIWEMSLA
jgi:hypothetical protein